MHPRCVALWYLENRKLKNELIGILFGLSYSGVSHAVKSVKPKLAKNRKLQTKFDDPQFQLLFLINLNCASLVGASFGLVFN
jgi:hypothetical protein